MRRSPLLFMAIVFTGCSSDSLPRTIMDAGSDASSPPDASTDASTDASMPPPPRPDGGITHPCSLPGSVQFTTNGTIQVPGGSPTAPSLAFLHLPTGFCAHYFGTVGNARQIRFAPGGELFVASPTTLTTGGGPNGQNAIVILPDDDLDGLADTPVTFLSNLGSTQGLLFANDHFYYQDQTKIMRVPYAAGQRAPSGASEQVANINYYSSGLHWPKAMDIADDGTIYVGNGGDQGELCSGPPHAAHGAVVKIDPAPGGSNGGGTVVAKGLRNPIAIRCTRGHNLCFALELAKDYTAGASGREKLIPIHQGDDWGFPCCASKNLPYGDISATDCGMVTADSNSFYIGDTPFGIDFEPGFWPGQWAGQAFVTTHGAAGSWAGARIVAIPMDASTGMPAPSTNINGPNVGMSDFATGWDDGTLKHGRPAAVTFSPDGRLFVASDTTGMIFWIAPLDM